MGVGKCGELESQELSIFGDGSGDLVVDRAAAGKELLGEPSPQTGEFVERFGHGKTLSDHCSRIGARPKRRNGVAPGDRMSGQGLPMIIVTRCYRGTMRLHDADYEDLLALRTGLRRILRWSEQQAEEAGSRRRSTNCCSPFAGTATAAAPPSARWPTTCCSGITARSAWWTGPSPRAW